VAAKSRRAIFCHKQHLTLPVPLEMVDQYVVISGYQNVNTYASASG